MYWCKAPGTSYVLQANQDGTIGPGELEEMAKHDYSSGTGTTK